MSDLKTVYIVDDDAAVRDALSILVKSVKLKPEEFPTADQFLQSYNSLQSGCLISDVYLPGMDGVALQERLIEMGSQLPMIVMSGHGDIPLAVKMIRRGALNFIEKPFRNHQMLEHIQQALNLDDERRSISRNNDQTQQLYATLTPREKEVMEFLLNGTANKVIARHMAISPRTIETHRANILRKMQSDSVVALTRQITNSRLTSQ